MMSDSQENPTPTPLSLPTLEFAVIPVKDLKPDPAQPRRKRSDASIKELADSIRSHGVLQTLLVRKENGEFIIVNGERRWLAAQLIGLESLLCLITTATSQEALVLQLIENIQREDLCPEDMATHLSALKSQFQAEDNKSTMRALSAAIGKSVGWVSEKLALSRLSDDVRTLKDNKVVKNARVLIGLSKLQVTDPVAAASLIKSIEGGKTVTPALISEIRGSQRKKRAVEKEFVAAADVPSSPATSAVNPNNDSSSEVQHPVAMQKATQSSTSIPAPVSTEKRARNPKVIEVAKIIGVSADLPLEDLIDAFASAFEKLHAERLQTA